MSLPIREVTFRKDGKIEGIELSKMTDELYEDIKDYVFCPNLKCNAKIIFASGEKRKYFRTMPSSIMDDKIIEQHVDNCPYTVEHEKELGRRKRYDPDLYVRISDKHLNDALARAFKKYVDPDYGKKASEGKNTTKSKSRQSKIDDGSITRGKASLIAPIDESEENKREPILFQKNINDITEIDYNTAKVVSGEAIDFIIKDTYKYIRLKLDNGKQGRIFFGEYFRVNNEAQYSQIDVYKKYIDYQKKLGNNVFVACFGEIIKDDFDVSVVMNDYKGIRIDDKNHYKILNYIKW